MEIVKIDGNSTVKLKDKYLILRTQISWREFEVFVKAINKIISIILYELLVKKPLANDLSIMFMIYEL